MQQGGFAMYLTPQEIAHYHSDGMLVVPALFTPDEVRVLQNSYERDALIPGAHRITEDNGDDVRAVYGSHQRQPEFAALVRSARLLEPARQLLAADVYVYQVKINAKPAFKGDSWSWHQDFGAWQIADELAAPNLVNVAVFLDDVDEFNGPVIFLPGSQAEGLIRKNRSADHRSEQHLDPEDIALTPADLRRLQCSMVSPKGPAGSVVFFHPEIVHGSAANMSPQPRRLLIVTYNDAANLPRAAVPRPDYLVGRDTRPLQVDQNAEKVLTPTVLAGTQQ
jgi:ectoine hydroxylase